MPIMPDANSPAAQLGLVTFPQTHDCLLTEVASQVVGSRADATTWAGCTLPDAPLNYVWVVGEDG